MPPRPAPDRLLGRDRAEDLSRHHGAASPAEVIAFACGLLGIEPPPLTDFDDADLSPMGRSFYADNKRVRNDRIKEELGVELRFPDYETGLRALLDT